MELANHTQVKVSGSMKDDPVNAIYKIQKSTRKGLCGELEGSFRSSKSINLFQQAVTLNRYPQHDFPQICGGSKYVFLVWIQSTQKI